MSTTAPDQEWLVNEVTAIEAGVVARIADIAVAPASVTERAELILEPLRRLVPYQAAWIAVRDPERRMHVPLATDGRVDALHAYFATPEADAELERFGLNRPRPPLLTSDLTIPLTETYAWAEHLGPAGFRGGLGAGLFTPDGRHVGFLSVLTESAPGPTPRHRDLIGALAPVIAHAVDRMRSLTVGARIVRSASAGIVLTRSGNTLPLPGQPSHPLLARGSPALAEAAEHLGAGARFATFLCPDRAKPATDAEPSAGLVRVTVLDCANDALDHLRAIVTLSPPGNLRGLTRTELQVLGLLAEGRSTQQIAAHLHITVTAIATCLDRARTALATPTRTAAVLRALNDGFLLPPRVTSTAH